jgi:hypothetical protein
MAGEQRAAQNVPICTPLAMNTTVLTTAHSGGYRATSAAALITESDRIACG